MLGKKKQSKEKRSNDAHKQLVNLGIVPDDEGSDDEAALEAELQRLMYDGSKGSFFLKLLDNSNFMNHH